VSPIYGQQANDAPQEGFQKAQNEYSTFQYATLAPGIAICRNMLENNGRISTELFRGSPLYGREKKEDKTGVMWKAFLDGRMPVFKGNDHATIEWLTQNAAKLERSGIGITMEADRLGSATYSLNNPSAPPELLTNEQTFELRHMTRQAAKAIKGGNLERADALSKPVIAFIEVSNLLHSSPATPIQATLHRVREQAFREMQKGKGGKANEMLEAAFGYMVMGRVLAELPADFPRELRTRFNSQRDAAVAALGRGDFHGAARISGLVLERIEREGEISKTMSWMAQIESETQIFDVRKMKVFQDTEGKFSQKRFLALTGVDYRDYRYGESSGRRGVGLLISRRMASALDFFRLSARELDTALDEFVAGRDGSLLCIRSEESRENALDAANAAIGMAACYSFRVPLKALKKLSLDTGGGKALGPSIKEALNLEKDKTLQSAYVVSNGMMNAFMLYAAGDYDGGRRVTAWVGKSALPAMQKGLVILGPFLEEDQEHKRINAAYWVEGFSLALEVTFVLATLGSGALEVGIAEYGVEELGGLGMKRLGMLAAKSAITVYETGDTAFNLGDCSRNLGYAEINGASPEEIERLRGEFTWGVFAASMGVAGDSAKNALKAGKVPKLIGRNLKRAVYAAKVVHNMDNLYSSGKSAISTYEDIRGKRWGEATLDAWKTVEPFALDKIDDSIDKGIRASRKSHQHGN